MTDQRAERPVVRTHAEAVAVAQDPDTYSSRVSRFLQVPNGMDGAEHAAMRRLLAPFLSPARMAALRPALERTAAGLLDPLADGTALDAVGDLGSHYAVRAQSAWLGWSPGLEDELIAWMTANHEATRSGELARTREVAERFDRIIAAIIAARREPGAAHDLTWELVHTRDEDGRTLPDPVLVSILRNWTGGDLGSLALCAGVVVGWLVADGSRQDEWRGLDDASLDAAIDEVLRIDDPFTSNRRVTTREVRVAGRDVPAGTQLVIDWTRANRDPAVFGDPDRYDPAGNADRNLVYGTGPHACPGRSLATLELRVLTRALLSRFRLESGGRGVRALFPLGGWESLPVVLRAPRPAAHPPRAAR